MKECFTKIIGWIYKRSKFKKGSTLIELIIAMSINLIIISLAFQIVNVSKKNIDFFSKESMLGDHFDDGLMTIDRITKGAMITNIEIVEGNALENPKITVTLRKENLKEKTIDKVISFNKTTKKVILQTYQGKYETGTNVIMRNVKDFIIKKKGFVLLESIIALGFLLILFEFGLNIAFNNFSKGKLYYNYEDRRTLSFEENRIINKLNLYVNENKNESENESENEGENENRKKYNKAKEDAMKGEKEEIIYTDSEYNNYYVIINDKYINIVEERSNQRRYVELIEKEKDNKIYFIPSGYRIDFVVKG